MFVKYEDPKVKELFEDLNDVGSSKHLMIRKIGMELAREIKKRYNQVSAFPTFYSLQNSRIGKVEALAGEMKGYYSMHVNANYRLIMKPDTEEYSAEALKKCDTVIIEGVTDYHGKGSGNNWIVP